MSYFAVSDGVLHHMMRPPARAVRLVDDSTFLLPPQVTQAHLAFKMWADAGWSPAPVSPARFWFTPQAEIAVEYRGSTRPAPVTHVGVAPDLAAWLVMLSQAMELFVVVARARAIWTSEELAGALTFTTPAYLPPSLLRRDARSWEPVAAALAQAVADGPLVGTHQDRHWQRTLEADG